MCYIYQQKNFNVMLKINGKVITDVVYKGKRIQHIMVGEKKYYDIYDGKIIGNALKADSIKINGKAYNYGAGYFEINVGELDSSYLGELFKRKGISTISHFGIDTRRVTDMQQMFYGCESLTNLNLQGLDTSKVKNMERMFNITTHLTTLNLGDKFDTSNVTNMRFMFWICGLTTLNLGDKFNTSNATNMNNMFRECTSLSTLNLGDKFDTSRVTDMQQMFYECSALKSLDISNFNTQSVTYMTNMFSNCSALSTLNLGDNFDAGKVINVTSMFWNCPSLKTITGCIKNLSISLNFSASPLDHDSAIRIINGLATVTTAQALALNNTTKATLSDTEKAILINKGWTLA